MFMISYLERILTVAIFELFSSFFQDIFRILVSTIVEDVYKSNVMNVERVIGWKRATTCIPACAGSLSCPSASCPCDSSGSQALESPSRKEMLVFIGPVRLCGCFLSAHLRFYMGHCVTSVMVYTPALKSYSSTYILVFSLLKLPQRFKAGLLRRKRSCCSVTMLSHGTPGNMTLQSGQ